MVGSIQSPTLKATSSPAKVLKRIIKNRMTGQLTLKDLSSSGIYWRIYFGEGKIHFAENTTGINERLQYLFQTYFPQVPLPSIEPGISAYQAVTQLWTAGTLTLQQTREILLKLTEEALSQLLVIPQAKVQFERNLGLDPILLNCSIEAAIAATKSNITRWLAIRSRISSPFLRLSAAEPGTLLSSLASTLPAVRDAHQADVLEKLSALCEDQSSLYTVAQHLNLDILELAEALHPLVDIGDLSLDQFSDGGGSSDAPVIACIDDSKAVQRKVKLTLESSGYSVVSLLEPARALTSLVRHRPQLILLDITMPQMNGYELCRLLRQSAFLKDVPILMLTGRNGAIDRLRAKMAGSSDYITKPFDSQDLLSRVSGYLLQTQAA